MAQDDLSAGQRVAVLVAGVVGVVGLYGVVAPLILTSLAERPGGEVVPLGIYVGLLVAAGLAWVVALVAGWAAHRPVDRPGHDARARTGAGSRRGFFIGGVVVALTLTAVLFGHALFAVQAGGPVVLFGLVGTLLALAGFALWSRSARRSGRAAVAV